MGRSEEWKMEDEAVGAWGSTGWDCRSVGEGAWLGGLAAEGLPPLPG